jgi:nitrate reductase delta subunit
MGSFSVIAEAFRYPAPGRCQQLEWRVAGLPNSEPRRCLKKFLKAIEPLDLGAWEELYTAALDLNPSAAPYIGFQTWGESYQRGEFMSKMNRALYEHDIDPEGELPDHIIPVLRYLDATAEPLPELLEVLQPAVRRAAGVLRKADGKNPYNHVFDAALHAIVGRIANPTG